MMNDVFRNGCGSMMNGDDESMSRFLSGDDAPRMGYDALMKSRSVHGDRAVMYDGDDDARCVL